MFTCVLYTCIIIRPAIIAADTKLDSSHFTGSGLRKVSWSCYYSSQVSHAEADSNCLYFGRTRKCSKLRLSTHGKTSGWLSTTALHSVRLYCIRCMKPVHILSTEMYTIASITNSTTTLRLTITISSCLHGSGSLGMWMRSSSLYGSKPKVHVAKVSDICMCLTGWMTAGSGCDTFR